MPEESSARDWTLFLQDMRRFCAKVSRYTEGLGQQQFLADELIVDAVLRNLELLGEAAKQIPPDVRLRHLQRSCTGPTAHCGGDDRIA